MSAAEISPTPWDLKTECGREYVVDATDGTVAILTTLKPNGNGAMLAAAPALANALAAALDWAGHHEENGMHWIASEQFDPDECPCAALALARSAP